MDILLKTYRDSVAIKLPDEEEWKRMPLFQKRSVEERLQVLIKDMKNIGRIYNVNLLQLLPRHLNDVFHKRIVMTHCKGLLSHSDRDFLIDDRTANGASEFGENLILFGSERYPNWESVLAKLLPAENSK